MSMIFRLCEVSVRVGFPVPPVDKEQKWPQLIVFIPVKPLDLISSPPPHLCLLRSETQLENL